MPTKTKTKDPLNVPVSEEQMALLRSYRPKDVGRAIERALDIGLAIADTPRQYLEVLAAVASRGKWTWTPARAWPQDREYYRVRVPRQLVKDATEMARAREIPLSDMLAIAMSYGVSCYKARKAMLYDLLKVDKKQKKPRGLLSDGKTYAGQAHFAIGPQQCQDCRHYRKRISPFTGKELRGYCDLYLHLMEMTNAPKIPRTAKACKEFFEKDGG